jgi:putative FmdB family regulatory protein
MPIYEFECLSCGQRFDRLQKLSDPDPTDCPSCGAPQVKRALTAASFRLKGGGWYETDFKGDKDKKRNLVEGGDGKGGDSKADSGSLPADAAKAETKVEAKPEAKVDKPATPAPPG